MREFVKFKQLNQWKFRFFFNYIVNLSIASLLSVGMSIYVRKKYNSIVGKTVVTLIKGFKFNF